MTNTSQYSDFIKEAYIDPIRSVLIIDDDYPTFDEVLSFMHNRIKSDEEEASSYKFKPKGWHRKPDEILNLLKNFHQKPLLVDIHDGQNMSDSGEEYYVHHLHQSDLLVLDFQLDGATGDGSKAIEIARSAMNNDHFNLIIVHTNQDLHNAFADMLLGLLPQSSDIDHDIINEGKNLISEKEDEDENILAYLKSTIGISQYLTSRKKQNSSIGLACKGEEPFTNFNQKCTEAGFSIPQIKKILPYLLIEFEKESDGKFNDQETELSWCQLEDKVFWIRSNSVFITFTSKRPSIDILEELLKGLIVWNPKPTRLFLTKLRSEIDEFGVAAEDLAMGNNEVAARWYKHLLENKDDDAKRRHAIGEAVSRHSEQLLSLIRSPVEAYANNLILFEGDHRDDPNAATKYHFEINLNDETQNRKAELEHNIFVCSKKPEGWHLTTGHIFLFNDKYWVCLSPACDMVPYQKNHGIYGEVGDYKPFIAVQLNKLEGNSAKKIDDLQSNRYVFIRNNDDIIRLSIGQPGDRKSPPEWNTFFAENSGIFSDDMAFNLSRVHKVKKLQIEAGSAKIIGQLRYEYALNFLQLLGINLTRIGLDFSGQ